MNPADYFQFILALIFVLGLIGLAAVLLRRFGPGGLMVARTKPGAARRLSVIDSLTLDPRRRLVLIRRDDKEHLLLLGSQSDIVVEGSIDPPPDALDEATVRNSSSLTTDKITRRFEDVVRSLGAKRRAAGKAAPTEREEPQS